MAIPLADVTFSTEALVLITAVVVTLKTAIVALWWASAARHAEVLADVRAQRDRLLDIALRHDHVEEAARAMLPGRLPPRDGGAP